MARDNELIISAGLDIPKTSENISKDLQGIGDKLSSTRTLKVVGNIDLSKTTTRIQSQLNTISKNLSIKIGDVDLNSIQNAVGKQLDMPTFKAKITPEIDKRSIKQQAEELEKMLGLKLPRGNTANTRKEIQSLLMDYKTAFQNNNYNEMQSAFSKLEYYIRPYRQEIEVVNDDLAEMQQRIKELARSEKMYISDKDYGELSYITGSKRDASSLLSKVFGVGNWTKDASKGQTTWDSKVQELNEVFQVGRFDVLNGIDSGRFADHIEGIVQLLHYLNSDFSNSTEYIKHYGQEIDDTWGDKLYDSLNKVLGLVSSSGDDFVEILGTESAEDIGKTQNSIKKIEDSYIDLIAVKKQYQDMYGVSGKDVSTQWIKDADGNLSGFSVTVKQLGGVVETFKHSIDDLGNANLVEIQGSDKGVASSVKELGRLKKELASFEQSHTSIMSGLSSPFQDVKDAINEVENGRGSIESVEVSINKLKKSAAEVGAHLKTNGKSLNIFDNAVNNAQTFGKTLEDLKVDVDNLISGERQNKLQADIKNANNELVKLQNVESEFGRGEDWSKQYEVLSKHISEIKNEVKSAQKAEKEFNNSISLENKISKTVASLNAYAESNRKAVNSTKKMSDGITTFSDKWNELNSRLKSGNLSNDEFRHLNEEIAIFKNEVKAAGLNSGEFFRKIGDQVRLVAIQWVSLNTAIQQTKQMVSQVIAVDDAMINLKKVTSETEEAYIQFLEKSETRAKKMHTTNANLITQASEWAKLGFTLEEIGGLAETSTVYAKVGEVDNKTAVSDLVSTMKAFNIEAENSMTIVDAFNKLGNEFAVDSAALGDGLSVSASTLAVAGNDLYESLALLTGGTEITQDANAMGNALRVISLRVRGMKGELQKLNEEIDGIDSVSKIQTQILNLTGNRVNIFDSNNNFRSTYDILQDISKIYNELSDPDRADLTEILFGKNRANQGIAIIQAFQSDQIEKAYKAAKKSAGSAMTEFNKMSEGVTTHIDDFKTAYESLATTFIRSDFLKDLVDTGTSLLNILDNLIEKFGVFPVLVTGLSLKGIGVFGTIADDATKSGQALTVFGKKFSDVVRDIRVSRKVSFSTNMSSKDLDSLKNFEQTIHSYVNEADFAERANAELIDSFSDSSSVVNKNAYEIIKLNTRLKEGKISQEAYNLQVQTFTSVAKKASIASKVLGTALRTALNFGVALLVNAAIDGISKLINKTKEAEEEAKRLKEEEEEKRKATLESSKTAKEEAKAIQELTERYIKLVSSTSDVASVKSELLNIQDEIIDKYAGEANKIDLVNGKLKKNLELLRRTEKGELKTWLRDHEDEIKTAEDYIEQMRDGHGYGVRLSEARQSEIDYESRLTDTKIWYNRMKSILEKNKVDGLFDFEEVFLEDAYGNNVHKFTIDIKPNLSTEDYQKALDQLMDAETQIKNQYGDGLDSDFLGLDDRRKDMLDKLKTYTDYLNILNDATERRTALNSLMSIDELDQSVIDDFYGKLEKVQKLSQEINNPENTYSDVYFIHEQMELLKDDISELVKEYPALSEEASMVFTNIGLNTEEAAVSTENLKQAFFESLGELQKGTLANVETIKQAMETMLSGGELSNEEAWNIWSFDQSDVIHPYLDGNNKLKISYQDLIKLKDDLINKEKERLRAEIETAKQAQANTQRELAVINNRIKLEAVGNSKPSNALVTRQSELTFKTKEWGDEIKRNQVLLRTLDSSLGDIISSETKIKLLQQDINKLQEEINDLQSKADDYEKAFLYKIDGVISGLEDEKEVLDNELDVLKGQLEVLEQQKEELEEIIDNYEQVADIISDAVDKEKELLEEQREAQEKAYNERIDALKEAHDRQEEENELTEKQVALQEKLQALDRAKNNKVSTYSAERGWHYDVDKEELLSAQKDVNDAQKDIDDYLSEKAYDAEIKAIEDERDAVLESYDIQIEAFEKYVSQWKEILEEQTKAENDRIAQEILGVDWRESIKNKDTQILNKYKSEFHNYNSQLSTLVDTEIANLQKSIEIKESEIKSKQEIIDQWQKYKSEAQNAINDIKNANEGYMQYLDGIVLDENSSFKQRSNTLANFVSNYSTYIDEIVSKSYELESARSQMDALAESAQNVSGALSGFSFDISGYMENLTSMITDSLSDIFGIFDNGARGYSNGGVDDYTGLAMLHGTKAKPEVVLNNGDAAKLYKSIHDSSFIDTMMSNIYNSLAKAIPFNKSSTNNNNNVFNINRMEIKANDPLQFHAQFQKELAQHYRFTLSESNVN